MSSSLTTPSTTSPWYAPHHRCRFRSYGGHSHHLWDRPCKYYPKLELMILRIFQRFRLVKFIEKFKTRVEKWENYRLSTSIYTSCSSHFIFTSVKINFLRQKIMKLLIWLTFLQNAAVFKVFKNNETVGCCQTFLNCFWNSNLHWKQLFRSSSNLNQTL